MEIEALQMTPVKMRAESHLGEEQPQQAVPRHSTARLKGTIQRPIPR